MKTAVAVAALAAGAVLGLACHSPPPPPPAPPPPPVAPPPPPPPPPPAPKCEALGEACTGHAIARIRTSGFSIVVPDGWTFAQQPDATVMAQGASILGVTTYETNPMDPTLSDTNRERAFQLLVNLLGVTTPRRLVWAKPSKKTRVGNLEMSLWQTEDVTKGLRRGPMLIFGTPIVGTWILGAGFVPADDNTDADRTIFGSIESIAPSPPATTTSP
jgi:hypothetical protein